MKGYFVRIAFLSAAAAIVGLAIGQPAQAGLIGQTFSAQYRYPNLTTVYPFGNSVPPSFIVGAGVEAVVNVENVTFISVDFGATSLALVFNTTLNTPTWNTADFNGLVFTATLPHGITGATVHGSTTMASFNDSRVTITGNEIQLNWNGLRYVDGTVVAIDFTAVPEPATLALFGASLLGLAAVWRRRRLPPSPR